MIFRLATPIFQAFQHTFYHALKAVNMIAVTHCGSLGDAMIPLLLSQLKSHLRQSCTACVHTPRAEAWLLFVCLSKPSPSCLENRFVASDVLVPLSRRC